MGTVPSSQDSLLLSEYVNKYGKPSYPQLSHKHLFRSSFKVKIGKLLIKIAGLENRD
jgi:hypothetical protein